MSPILEIRENGGRCFRLLAGVTRVGRSAENEIQIDDPSVSAHHCEITVESEGVVIHDLNSTNGTFVDGQPVQAAALRIGQAFRVGGVQLLLCGGDSLSPDSVRQVEARRGNRITQEGRKALAIGLILAIGVAMVPPLAYILDFLRLIIHETGHTVTAWCLGYPTIPQMRSGGALSVLLVRPKFLVWIMVVVLGKVLYDAHKRKRHRVAIGVGAALYLVIAFSGLRWLVIAAMGHAAELITANIFLYRAISGKSLLHPAERPLYAMIAFFVFGTNLIFAGKLLGGSEAEQEYREGFEGQTHDLVRIADEYLQTDFSSVILAYFLVSLFAPLAGFVYYRFSRRASLVMPQPISG